MTAVASLTHVCGLWSTTKVKDLDLVLIFLSVSLTQ